jgi:hypothetical protein
MPRYFFHLRGEGLLLEDCEGKDLPSLYAAIAEVLHAKREVAVDQAVAYGLAFEVTDSSGRVLLKVPLSERQGSQALPPLQQGTDAHRRGPDEKLPH